MKLTLSSLPAVYINVDSETDKNTTFLETMSRLGYKNITRHSTNSKKHLDVLTATKNVLSNMGSSSTAPFILFGDGVREFNYEDKIDIPDDADAVYLGLQVTTDSFDATPVPGFNGVYRVKKPTGMQAVLYVTKRYIDHAEVKYENVITNPSGIVDPINQTVDYPLAEAFNVYAIGPMFYQHEPENPVESNLTRITDIEKMTISPITF